MADVSSTLQAWSVTANNNNPSGATNISTGLDDNLRELQAVVRGYLANAATDVASASTTDLGAVASNYIRITGTTTITALGTVSAGIWKFVRFAGALTFTHNATSLILPGGANITTVAGDCALMVSEGSGNWRCLQYTRVSDPVGTAWTAYTPTISAEAGTWGSPTIILARYQQRGKTLYISLRITATVATGSPVEMRVLLPNSLSGAATSQYLPSPYVVNNGTPVAGLAIVAAGGTYIAFSLIAGTSWDGGGPTSVTFTGVLEVA